MTSNDKQLLVVTASDLLPQVGVSSNVALAYGKLPGNTLDRLIPYYLNMHDLLNNFV